MQGEDSVAGGGIYFKQFDFTSKDAISTLQGARGAAMLYRAPASKVISTTPPACSPGPALTSSVPTACSVSAGTSPPTAPKALT